jgi:hypothetical protein
MPLRNRVDPCGAIFASPSRGTLIGNRGGVLHNDERMIVRQFMGRRWLACVLEFKGRRRAVMSPGRYTELFFLDEAVALAAGHRPCAECRRERFNAFQNAWKRSHQPERVGLFRAPEIDLELHRARINPQGRKITWQSPLNTLPDGCFVQANGFSYLVWGDALLQWSPAGYIGKELRQAGLTATVLTPKPIVECIRQGYKPAIHNSASAYA